MADLDEARVDRIIQLSLAVAAREDEFRSRRLGPIHLLKYVYLADLAYAEQHGGETFTGARWRFHHFGPWAESVFARITPATAAIEATVSAVPSKYDTDTVRYSVDDYDLADRLERGLPWQVVSAVRRAVREHGSDTYSLLNAVYLTAPMLKAAPEEQLVFEPKAETPPPPPREQPPPMTVSARRRKAEAAERLRAAVTARLEARLSRTPRTARAPRYDEIFFEGVAALDAEAGGDMPTLDAEADAAPEIWKSPGRSDAIS